MKKLILILTLLTISSCDKNQIEPKSNEYTFNIPQEYIGVYTNQNNTYKIAFQEHNILQGKDLEFDLSKIYPSNSFWSRNVIKNKDYTVEILKLGETLVHTKLEYVFISNKMILKSRPKDTFTK